MTAASDYAELKILDHLLGTTAWTMPSGCYMKLHIGAAGEDGTANAATEATRKAVTFDAAAAGATANDAAITWTSVSTTETYSHFSLWDASTAGNCLIVGALGSSVAVTAGDTFEIAIGDLDITAD